MLEFEDACKEIIEEFNDALLDYCSDRNAEVPFSYHYNGYFSAILFEQIPMFREGIDSVIYDDEPEYSLAGDYITQIKTIVKKNLKGVASTAQVILEED